jgi:hypothetical protein
MKFRHNNLQFLKWNISLAFSLGLLLLSKHSALESLILASALQWSGIALLLACWVVTVFQCGKVDKSFLMAIVLSAFLLVEFAFSDFQTLPNFLNSLTVLLAFPVAISLGRRLEGDSFGRFVIYTTIGVVIAGAIIAPEWSVSYMGDTRESRTTLGFLRPTFLAEAGLLMIFAAGLRQGRQWHVITLALALIYISGGRTALVVAAIYMAYTAYSRLDARGRFRLLTFCTVAVVMVVSYALLTTDQSRC